jgi:HEAT repeat protein
LIEFNSVRCWACGSDIGSLSARSYEEKLVSALTHPLTHVRERAALLLGAIGGPEAFEHLMRRARATGDPFVAAAALHGLEALRVRHPDLPPVDWRSFAGPESPFLVRFAVDEIASREPR